jgi:hypothetical protein
MFQNVLMDFEISKKKQISLFFSMSFEIFVSFQLIFWNLCVFEISYTCKHVISEKCKYVWFHLNMLPSYFKRLTKEQTCQCKRWVYNHVFAFSMSKQL